MINKQLRRFDTVGTALCGGSATTARRQRGIPSDIPAGSLKIAFFEKGRLAYDEESGLLSSSPLPSLPFPLSLCTRACVRCARACVVPPVVSPSRSHHRPARLHLVVSLLL